MDMTFSLFEPQPPPQQHQGQQGQGEMGGEGGGGYGPPSPWISSGPAASTTDFAIELLADNIFHDSWERGERGGKGGRR